MTAIAISNFSGQAPKTNQRQLAPNMAQKSINTKLWSTLEPFKEVAAVITPTKAGADLSMYRLGQGLAETQFWMTWATDVDVVRGQIAGDTTERTYYTGDGAPKVTDASLCSTGGTNYPVTSYPLGVPKPASPLALTISGTGTGLPISRSYVFTYVSAWGEESQPSPATLAQNILFGQSAALSAITVAPTGSFNIATKRIYRTSTGSYGTSFLFVAEIPVATTIYADTVLDENLGEAIPSNAWLTPPVTLTGLIALPNGVMAGFSANEVLMSEPYKPYAWPLSNMQSTDYPIVALGHYGGVLVVGTTGTPYMVVGVDPANATMQKMEVEQACVSKRSMVSMGTGVCYASPDGLVYASGGGAALATKNHFTRDQWQALAPSSIHAYLYDGRYFGFYNTGVVSGGFIFAPEDGLDGLVMIDIYATSAYVDPVLDALYLKIAGNIVKWDSHATLKKTMTWKSKVFVMPKPCNMSCAQVVAAAYPLTVNIYADGALKRTQSVTDDKPFRLPGGFLARDWEIEIIGTTEIYSAYLAESMMELANG